MMHFPLRGAGTGIYVDNPAPALLKKGHEVRVVCSDHFQPEKEFAAEAVLLTNGDCC